MSLTHRKQTESNGLLSSIYVVMQKGSVDTSTASYMLAIDRVAYDKRMRGIMCD